MTRRTSKRQESRHMSLSYVGHSSWHNQGDKSRVRHLCRITYLYAYTLAYTFRRDQSHVPHLNESRRTGIQQSPIRVIKSRHVYQRVTSHTSNDSLHPCQGVTSHIATSHVTCLNQSCHTSQRIMSHVSTSHVTCLNESCHTDVQHDDLQPPPHEIESPHTYKGVMALIPMSHVTHVTHFAWHIFTSSLHKSMSHITHTYESCHTGIRHYDLQFPDCSVPPPAILERFLAICDKEGPIAVHCLAGLGRTVPRVYPTYEWVMSNMWMSHVPHMNESCPTCEWVMSHVWMSHVPHMNESCPTCEWVMSHVWMSHALHMNESCPRYEWVMFHIWMIHIRYEWVMS